MNRTRRRHFDRHLRKLFRRDNCSICGSPFRHNSRTAGGLDAQGSVVLAGECCLDRVAAVFVQGIYSARQIDFPWARCGVDAGIQPASGAGSAEAVGLLQDVLTETDKVFDDMMRHGGDMPVTPRLNLLDSAWKDDDRLWFERNPERSHRMRLPFPGEADKEVAATPPGYVLMILLRQVDPGRRARAAVSIDNDLLPLPDDEAAVHALFEAAMGREDLQPDRQALDALSEKYAVHRERGQ